MLTSLAIFRLVLAHFISVGRSVFGGTGARFHWMSLGVGRGSLFDSLSIRKVSVAVIVAFLFGGSILCFGSLAVRNLAKFAAFSLPADIHALAALSIPEFREPSVVGRVFMSSDAVSFRSFASAPDIDKLRDGLQMIGVDASGNSAEVIQDLSVRNGSAYQFPRKDVGQAVFSFEAQPAISVGIESACPKPAGSRFEDLRVECLVKSADVRNGREYLRAQSAMATRQISPPDVFARGARLKVIWIDALGDAAFMVQRQAFRDRPVNQLVRESMGKMSLAAVGEVAVAGFVDGPDPKPTGRSFQDSRVKSLIKSKRAGHGLVQYARTLRRCEWGHGT